MERKFQVKIFKCQTFVILPVYLIPLFIYFFFSVYYCRVTCAYDLVTKRIFVKTSVGKYECNLYVNEKRGLVAQQE